MGKPFGFTIAHFELLFAIFGKLWMDGWMDEWILTNTSLFSLCLNSAPNTWVVSLDYSLLEVLPQWRLEVKWSWSPVLISWVGVIGQIYQLLPGFSTCLLVRLISLILTPCVLIGLKGSSCHPGSKVAWPVTSFISLPTEGVDKMQSHRVSYIWKHDSWHGGIDSICWKRFLEDWCCEQLPEGHRWMISQFCQQRGFEICSLTVFALFRT